MDRMLYIAMTGAKHTMWQQATVSNNLANATTTGFRAELDSFRALPVNGDGLQTRTFVVNSTAGVDFTPGAFQQTGRDLDVAIQGKGWIAVQTPDGSEAYTRNGSLQISVNGVLQTRGNMPIVGDAGPLSIPPETAVTVAKDGTVSTVPEGQNPNSVSVVGRIKLVNPPEADLVRGADGLFRLVNGTSVPADVNVTLSSGALESSNVSTVDALVGMISLGRQFEMQMKLIQNADSNARAASQILNLNA
jgi:flagellar basal-body rod protein FlgF